MNDSDVNIRPFAGQADIQFAASMTRNEKWYGETETELITYYRRDKSRCLIAESEGQKVGFCIATAYQSQGLIGMLIVSPAFRKQGIGTSLVREGVKFLKGKGVQTICLDSVSNAIPFFKPLGFREICRSLRFFGEIEPGTSPEISEIRPQDLNSIFEIDKKVFGQDRTYFLQQRLKNHPNLAFKLSLDGDIMAYLFGREGIGGWVEAGPFVSLIPCDTAMPLLQTLQERIGFCPFSIGVLETQKEMILQLVQAGLKPNPDSPVRMKSAGDITPGSDPCCLAIGAPAKG
jgi:ribosomal protein S18 acetylase RimI-like enzyme